MDFTWTGNETDGYTKATGHEIFSWECIDDDQHQIACRRCREAFTVDHTWDGGTVTDPATCTENGKKLYTCTGCRKTKEEVINAGHDYGEWTSISDTQHERICSLDPAHVETANHSWDAGTVKEPATCYNTETMLYTCTVCKGTKTESIPKLQVHGSCA